MNPKTMNRAKLTLLLILTGVIHTLSQISPQEAVERMERGINLGNTLEPPYEGGWNNPAAEEEYFDLYRNAGFDVVRVPVRWDQHTGTHSPYQVDVEWMDRVEEVIDWGLERGLFVVMNAHHEEWIKEGCANPALRDRFDSIWSQIATRFRNKTEKLIFEIINEPHGLTREQNNELHQRVLSIIRKTNPTRLVIIQGHNWGGSEELIEMAIPDDPFLIGSFHSYDPWPFGLEGTGSFGSRYQLQQLENKFVSVKQWSDQTGIPVFLGEFGCNRSAGYNSRMKHYRAYVDLSLSYGFSFCVWDDGGNFKVMQRSLKGWDEVKDILIHSGPEAPRITGMDVENDTMVRVEWERVDSGALHYLLERRRMTGTFQVIDTLPHDGSVYVDSVALDGEYNYYRIVANYHADSMTMSHPLRISVPAYVELFRGYYHDGPIPVPGTVEAEDYDTGGEGLTFHDLDKQNLGGAYRPDEPVDIYDRLGDGYHIGNALPGEWCEYSIHVERKGLYEIELHTASLQGDGRYQLWIGEQQSDTIRVPVTYSQLETAISSVTMALDSGEMIMRLIVMDGPMFNIDRVVFHLNTTSTRMARKHHPDLFICQIGSGELLVTIQGRTDCHRLELIGMGGAMVRSIESPDGESCLSTGGLTPGVYLVRAVTSEGIYHQKTFIQ